MEKKLSALNSRPFKGSNSTSHELQIVQMTCLKYHPYQRKNRLLCLSWVVVLAVVALFPTVWDLSVSVGQKSPSVKTSNCLPHSLHFLLFCSIVVVMDWPWDSWLAHQRTANQCHQLTQTSKRCTHWSRFNQRTLTTLMSSSIWRSVRSASMQMALTEGRSCIKKSIGTEQRGGSGDIWKSGQGVMVLCSLFFYWAPELL